MMKILAHILLVLLMLSSPASATEEVLGDTSSPKAKPLIRPLESIGDILQGERDLNLFRCVATHLYGRDLRSLNDVSKGTRARVAHLKKDTWRRLFRLHSNPLSITRSPKEILEEEALFRRTFFPERDTKALSHEFYVWATETKKQTLFFRRSSLFSFYLKEALQKTQNWTPPYLPPDQLLKKLDPFLQSLLPEGDRDPDTETEAKTILLNHLLPDPFFSRFVRLKPGLKPLSLEDYWTADFDEAIRKELSKRTESAAYRLFSDFLAHRFIRPAGDGEVLHLILTDTQLQTRTDTQLKTHKDHLEAFLQDHPGARVIIDFSRTVNPYGTLRLKGSDLPSNLKHLIVTNTSKTLRVVGNDFLRESESLTHFNGQGWSLRSVGNGFLFWCSYLTHFNGQGWPLQSVGDKCLSWCNYLTHFNGQGWPLQSVGNNFLSYSHSLTHFNGQGWLLRSVRDDFLSYCGATHFNGQGWPLQEVGHKFLSYWTSLTHFNGQGWPLKFIGWAFLYKGKTLKSLDVRGWALESVGKKFVFKCPNPLTIYYSHKSVRAQLTTAIPEDVLGRITWVFSSDGPEEAA